MSIWERKYNLYLFRVNHDSAQKLSEVSNNNDIDIHNIVSDETTHIETPQLDVIETKEEEDTNMLCSVSIHADSSLSNKQDDDHSIIMIEGKCQSIFFIAINRFFIILLKFSKFIK